MNTQEVEIILETYVHPDEQKRVVSVSMVTHFKGRGQR